jgi:hypothetical protein
MPQMTDLQARHSCLTCICGLCLKCNARNESIRQTVIPFHPVSPFVRLDRGIRGAVPAPSFVAFFHLWHLWHYLVARQLR